MSNSSARSARESAIALAIVAFAVAVCANADVPPSEHPRARSLEAISPRRSPADPASFLPWYASIPTPIASAFVSLGGAFGAANIYNSGTCYFICNGAPGAQSHHVLAYGNDLTANVSYTHNGAADDCIITTPPPSIYQCPGGIENSAFGVTLHAVPEPSLGPYPATVDGNGNLGVLSNLYAGGAIAAGGGNGTPGPPPSTGSLISYTGTGAGEVLLGSAGGANYAKCDYGETILGKLTCNEQFVIAAGGVRPNGPLGGYAAEAFPLGVAASHPKVLSGSCAVGGTSGACTFPNGFQFADTSYTCAISAQGSDPLSGSYTKSSASQITIYNNSVGAGFTTFSYICAR
jgi:hypothetical protein